MSTYTTSLNPKPKSLLHSQVKKGTKAVTGAVPFQKVHFCIQRLHIDSGTY